jgi:hypothetical protein
MKSYLSVMFPEQTLQRQRASWHAKKIARRLLLGQKARRELKIPSIGN